MRRRIWHNGQYHIIDAGGGDGVVSIGTAEELEDATNPNRIYFVNGEDGEPIKSIVINGQPSALVAQGGETPIYTNDQIIVGLGYSFSGSDRLPSSSFVAQDPSGLSLISPPPRGYSGVAVNGRTIVGTASLIVPESHMIITSLDCGKTWVEIASPKRLQGVAYGNGVFVVSGNDGYIASSEDGITWTERTTPSLGNHRSAPFFSKTFTCFFVGTQNAGIVLRSSDGITWENTTNPGNSLTGFIDGPDRVVALSTGTSAGRESSAYTTNGTTWVRTEDTPSTNVGLYLNDKYVVSSGESIDGVSWTYGNPSYTTQQAIVYDQFSEVALSIDRDLYARRGLSVNEWVTSTRVGAGFFGVSGSRAAINGDNIVVVSGSDTTPPRYSSDLGVTWQSASSSFVASCVAYGGGNFVAASTASTAGIRYTTDNGATWNNASSVSGTSFTVNYMTYGGGSFVGVGTNYAVVSTDGGVNWTVYSKGGAGTSVAYGNGVFTCAGPAGAIYYSTNGGVSWSNYIIGGTALAHIRYSPNGFFVLASSGTSIARSTNGTTSWSFHTAPAGSLSQQSFVGWGGGIYTNRVEGDTIYTLDGMSWQAVEARYPKILSSCYLDGGGALIYQYGKILYTEDMEEFDDVLELYAGGGFVLGSNS